MEIEVNFPASWTMILDFSIFAHFRTYTNLTGPVRLILTEPEWSYLTQNTLTFLIILSYFISNQTHFDSIYNAAFSNGQFTD